MSNFINTVDVIGDEALTDSIIDRSITEFRDNRILAVGKYSLSFCDKLATLDCPSLQAIGHQSFRACNSLTYVKLPALVSLADYAFYNSMALRDVDFSSIVSMGASAFQYCYALKTVILRGETMCSLANANALANTPIADGLGYIYAHRAFVDTYKAATNWSTYATRFRVLEDYTVDGTTTGELDPTKI